MSHLRCTYLGWQGFCVQSTSTCLFIDPLLLDEVGRGPGCTRANFHFGLGRVFTPRHLPSADAVLITHEHEDHFNLPSLARISRTVPLYVSDGLSLAGREILREMGFTMNFVRPRDTVRVGDLRLTFFGSDLLAESNEPANDEWDTLAYGVFHDHGCFFSNVDIGLRLEMLDWLEEHTRRSDILTVIYGSWYLLRTGFKLDGNLKRNLSAKHLAEALGAAEHCEVIDRVAAVAGATCSFDNGSFAGAMQAAYVKPRRQANRIKHIPFQPRGSKEPDAPVTGRYLGADQRTELAAPLRELAGQLYGRWLFRLAMMMRRAHEPKRPLALFFRYNETMSEWAYEYQPTCCNFVPVDVMRNAATASSYCGVALLWAADFLAIARGELEPRNAYRAMRESWSPEPPPHEYLTRVLWWLYHPLHYPEAVLQQYRAALQDETDAPLWIQSRAR